MKPFFYLRSFAWSALLGSMLLLWGCPKSKEEVVPAPVAAFSYTPSSALVAPVLVRFYDESKDATAYEWDFGDGSRSSEREPDHEYRSAGTYTVRLRVSNKGGSSSASQQLVVQQPAPLSGTHTFWVKSDLGIGPISVTVDGKAEGTITQFHANGVGCGQANVNVTRTPGTYAYKATSATGRASWEGSFTIEAGKCKSLELVLTTTGNADCAGWRKRYGGESEDILTKAVRLPDGSFLLAGTSRSGLPGHTRKSPNLNRYGDIWLTRVGADGKALWDKAFDIPSDLFAEKNTLSDLIATRDGGVAFIGTRKISGGTTAMLFKLGPDLSEQWQKPITVLTFATPKLCEMPDGSILVGTEQFNVKGKQDPRAVCFRTDGSIRWDRSYTLEARKQFDFINLKIDKALVAGEGNYQFTIYYTTIEEGLATLLFRINADGLPLWEKKLAANGSATDAAADGSFLLVDNAFTPNGPTACQFGGCSRVGEVARIDRNGSVVWRKTLRRTGMSWNSIHTASRIGNGYLLGGITGGLPLGTETWVVKLDDSGTQKWDLLVDEDTGYQFAKSMSDADDPRIMSILPTPDGGFFIGATRREVPTPGEPIDPDWYASHNFMGIKVNSCALTNGRLAAPTPLRPAKAPTK